MHKILKQLCSFGELFPIVEHPGTFKSCFRDRLSRSNFRQFVVRTLVFLMRAKVLTTIAIPNYPVYLSIDHSIELFLNQQV
ncbi:hypothetical protein QUB41_23880 [Microcoleus sp. AT8-B2]|uniref:hypothetical protein n=1 Tax=unclassified Microcoleus TaxID=2642155 RepID=UPI002FCF561E